jgi:UDP-N-acetylmuramoyl-L-alanyl-D-glutamate--2,6-diaminopimelate ligase
VTGLRPEHTPNRTLAQVAARLGVGLAQGADGDEKITGVTHDSRAVRRGDLYAALPGERTHGATFAEEAARAGARAVLTDPAGAVTAGDSPLPLLVVDDPRAMLGALAAWIYGDPAQELLLLGVTGTNGKTTTTFLLDAALRGAGHVTGLVGTVETRIAEHRVPSVRTTPEAPDLHALFSVMREAGVTACSMEVSSHALALHRADGAVFDVVGFTNLSQDHLDFHGSLEDYFEAKASLFTPGRARRGVVVVDDEWGRRLAGTTDLDVVTLATLDPSVGVLEREPDWRVVARHAEEGGRTSFALRRRDGHTLRAVCPLPGDFNVANTALALVMLIEAGVDPAAAVLGLELSPGVPGRMEQVRPSGGAGRPDGPLAVVDYAHTPDAIEAALRALRPSTPGRLAVVLGAGGDRDAGKRPAMGAAAARAADLVVVTDDNPRSEDPAAIRAAVLEGARSEASGSGARVVEVADRREAVRFAAREAPASGDTVLVAGKGHERGQEIGGTVHPFDDREVLRQALEEDE